MRAKICSVKPTYYLTKIFLRSDMQPFNPGLRTISAFKDAVSVRDTKQVRPHFDRHLIVAGMRKRFIL